MTIVSTIRLRQGAEPDWDAAMRDRLAAARRQPGWIAAQILVPLGAPDTRVIVGTWETRADWEAWHNDPAFAETRRRLAGLEAEPARDAWHETIVHTRRDDAAERRAA
ncbi:MAG TPA: antibiotic biosynthesis monooxygenase family protein [Dehalococcoidia bacterium]|nr:antibiotic biosynthesis monooxygenase family protein [Dehalococcoidia bacterium]